MAKSRSNKLPFLHRVSISPLCVGSKNLVSYKPEDAYVPTKLLPIWRIHFVNKNLTPNYYPLTRCDHLAKSVPWLGGWVPVQNNSNKISKSWNLLPRALVGCVRLLSNEDVQQLQIWESGWVLFLPGLHLIKLKGHVINLNQVHEQV